MSYHGVHGVERLLKSYRSLIRRQDVCRYLNYTYFHTYAKQVTRQMLKSYRQGFQYAWACKKEGQVTYIAQKLVA